ncbi:pilus assembly FimT family protein [Aliinostoc sp. HNIBRCY26]|uniref:pilus assembly FimT family protein n=1 Tax=Aliinostoc sp. HNIBRCY26 TaxID=3418997 RepID=UPI003D08F19B
MKSIFNLYIYCQIIKSHHHKSIRGFTLVETLTIFVMIGILSAIAIPSWLSFVRIRYLNTAQDDIYQAMRQAQSQAKKEKSTWQASFREQSGSGRVEWAVHPATVSPANAVWNSLEPDVRLDEETTLQIVDGVRQIQFDYLGSVRKPPLGKITLSSKYGGKAKRCVIVSTILGAIRKEKEKRTANSSDDYCY